MTFTLEQSFKKRLQDIAKERNITTAEVWQNVILERFLVRLCRSPYRDNFILKGGILLAKHTDIGRETKDLDFSVQKISNDLVNLHNVIGEIIKIDVGDGFEFLNHKVEELAHLHMQYPGASARIETRFGKSRFVFFVDLGFGDVARVQEKAISLVCNSIGPLFEAVINVQCYPMSFVFAEKLETVVSRGAGNSRMKDFHDLFTMVGNVHLLEGKETEQAIRLVFEHRKTAIQWPIRFKPSSIASLQKYWNRYHSSVSTSAQLPSHIEQVIGFINEWLSKHTAFSEQKEGQ